METMKSNQSGTQIKESWGGVTVDNVKDALPNQKGEITKHRAQLRQIIERTYPAAKAHDSLTDPLFALEEFGFGKGTTYNENRVAWIDVPIGTTVEQVAEKLAALPKAKLVRHLSLNPILTEEQARAIQNGIVSLEDIASKQTVRDGDENIVPYKGYLQYRVNKFSADNRPDIDNREAEYAENEVAGVPKPFQMASPASVIAKTAGQAASASAPK